MTQNNDELEIRIGSAIAQFDTIQAQVGIKADGLFASWFLPSALKFRQTINDMNCDTVDFNEEEYIKFMVGINANLNMRDAYIVMSMHELDEYDLRLVVTKPFKQQSSHIIKNRLAYVFHDPSVPPDGKRTYHALSIVENLINMTPEQYRAPLYSMKAYLLWWVAQFSEAFCAVQKALHVQNDYTLARILEQVLQRPIIPAWYQKQLESRE